MRNFCTLVLSLSVVSTLSFGSNHWDADQVRKYVHSSELQRRTNIKLISTIKFEGNEKILDIGCGDGRTTAVLSEFSPRGTVLGIDPNLNMLTWAKKQFLTGGYDNLDFLQADYTTINDEDSFDIVTGFYSFHTVKSENRDKAISNIYSSLKKGGRLYMTIPPHPETNKPWSRAIGSVLSSEKWQSYFPKNSNKSFTWENEANLSERFYKQEWSNMEFKFIPYTSPFVDRTEFVSWILGTLDFVQAVPEELRNKLVDEIIDCYAMNDSTAEKDGVWYGKWGYYTISATK